VAVLALEPLRELGLVQLLRASPGLVLQRFDTGGRGGVIVADLPRAGEGTLRTLRSAHREHGWVTVALVDETTDLDIGEAADSGVAVMLHPAEASRSGLVTAVQQASGSGPAMPADLAEQFRRLRGAGPAGRPDLQLSERQAALLRHLAEGLDTIQVAKAMHISERTAKHILSEIMHRFSLRNRVHAVAFAIRAGLI
jgi:DNA-binding NarL/FixJ family response regulator